MSLLSFESEDDLRAWLERHGIDTSAWTKPVGALWKEYRSGEAVLSEDPPARATSVVRVIIRKGDKVLHEVDQVLPGGRRRPRNSPLSEKMKPGESVLHAALRGVQEELRRSVPEENARPSQTPVEVKVASSPSYPGLASRYTFYECEVDVPGLPDGPFSTFEDGDAVSEHHWEWRVENNNEGG